MELPKKNNKNVKKKKFQGQRQEYTKKWKKQTLANNINITNILKKKKRCDINKIIYLITIKKAILLATALSQKTSIDLGNFCVGD